nr:hypothetical protein B13N20.160 [imported] - Neurospora crassa [Neurospora crassa]
MKMMERARLAGRGRMGCVKCWFTRWDWILFVFACWGPCSVLLSLLLRCGKVRLGQTGSDRMRGEQEASSVSELVKYQNRVNVVSWIDGCGACVWITAVVGNLDRVGQRLIAMDNLLEKCTNLLLFFFFFCS